MYVYVASFAFFFYSKMKFVVNSNLYHCKSMFFDVPFFLYVVEVFPFLHNAFFLCCCVWLLANKLEQKTKRKKEQKEIFAKSSKNVRCEMKPKSTVCKCARTTTIADRAMEEGRMEKKN